MPTKRGASFRELLASVQLAYVKLWNDLRVIHHQRRYLWIFLLIWFSGLFLSILTLFVSTLPATANGYNSGGCQPDNTFSFNPDSFSYWTDAGFFDITLGFGTFSFTQAKVIDVCFDVVSDISFCVLPGPGQLNTPRSQVMEPSSLLPWFPIGF
jgi:hypothetical protein